MAIHIHIHDHKMCDADAFKVGDYVQLRTSRYEKQTGRVKKLIPPDMVEVEFSDKYGTNRSTNWVKTADLVKVQY